MTKLTTAMKIARKDYMGRFPNVVFFALDGVTVGVERTGETMGRFAVAIAAQNEPRFKRKVGEYTVLRRFFMGETLPTKLFEKSEAEDAGDRVQEDADNLLFVIEEIARAVSLEG